MVRLDSLNSYTSLTDIGLNLQSTTSSFDVKLPDETDTGSQDQD